MKTTVSYMSGSRRAYVRPAVSVQDIEVEVRICTSSLDGDEKAVVEGEAHRRGGVFGSSMSDDKGCGIW